MIGLLRIRNVCLAKRKGKMCRVNLVNFKFQNF